MVGAYFGAASRTGAGWGTHEATIDMPKLDVLLADDSQTTRSNLRQLLEEDFDVVGEVSRGDAVVEAAEALRPEVIVLDISMPGISGIEAARLLRERDCNSAISPCIGSRVGDALRTPGAGYILKARRAQGAEPGDPGGRQRHPLRVVVPDESSGGASEVTHDASHQR